MEEKKIQFEGISDEETWKLFSWFEKLINQSETKKVIRFLDFINKKPEFSWKKPYTFSFFAQVKDNEKKDELVNKDFLIKRIDKLYEWKVDKFMTDIYLQALVQWKNANLKEIIREMLNEKDRSEDNNRVSLFERIYKGVIQKTTEDDPTEIETIFVRIDWVKSEMKNHNTPNAIKKAFEDYLYDDYDTKSQNLDLFDETVQILEEEYYNFLKDKKKNFIFDENLWSFIENFVAASKIKDEKQIISSINSFMSDWLFFEKSWLSKQNFKILLLENFTCCFLVWNALYWGNKSPETQQKIVERLSKLTFIKTLLDKEFMSDFDEKWRQKLLNMLSDYQVDQLTYVTIYNIKLFHGLKEPLVNLWIHTFWEELINQPWWEFFKKPIDLVPLVVQLLYKKQLEWSYLLSQALKGIALSKWLESIFSNTPKEMLILKKTKEIKELEEEKRQEEENRERIKREEKERREREQAEKQALKEIEKKKEEFERENQKLKKRQESIKLKLAWDKEYNNIIKQVLSKKIDISKIEVNVYYIPYWEDTLDTKIWRVSSEILNKKTTPLQFATYYKILKVFENMSEPLEDFIYSMRRRYEIFQNDKKLFEKVFREHLSDVYFLTKEEQDVIIWEMKRMFWDDWAFIDAFYIEFMPDLIGCVFLTSQDEACFPASIKEIELVQKYNFNDDEEDEEDDDIDDTEEDEESEDLEDDEDNENYEEELQELKERQKRVKEKLDNDKWFQDIIKKILSKKIDISQMDIRIHVIPYWEDTLDTKSLKVSQKLINFETTPLLFVTYLKILKVLQISPFDELEEFFASMLKKLEKYELDDDLFEKKFREHLSDVYLLTKEEQDALLKSLVFDWHIKYAYDFYEYFMEEFVGKVYTSYMDEKCFPSSIEEIELVENNKSIRL